MAPQAHIATLPWSTLKPSLTDALNNLSFNLFAKASTSSLHGGITSQSLGRCLRVYLRCHHCFVNKIDLILHNRHHYVTYFILHLSRQQVTRATRSHSLNQPSFSNFRLLEMNPCQLWRMLRRTPEPLVVESI